MKTRIGGLISFLYRKNQIFLGAAMKSFDLSTSEYPVLLALYCENALTQEDLTSRLSLDKSAVARAIHTLETKGFVLKSKDDGDQRCNRITLTEKSRKVKPHVMKALDQWNEILMSDMNEQERDLAYGLLARMTENIKKEMN